MSKKQYVYSRYLCIRYPAMFTYQKLICHDLSKTLCPTHYAFIKISTDLFFFLNTNVILLESQRCQKLICWNKEFNLIFSIVYKSAINQIHISTDIICRQNIYTIINYLQLIKRDGGVLQISIYHVTDNCLVT